MARWSRWRPFPDFRTEGYPQVYVGPGVYELRRRSTRERILVGEGGILACRMVSLLPASHGGVGTRRNSRKREYVAEHRPDVEYRTRRCSTKAEARELERQMLRKHEYRFPT